ncbi:MAG: zinc-dependent metalloprotease [Acidobacteriota bacterium]
MPKFFSSAVLFLASILLVAPASAQEELRARRGPVREVAGLDDAALRAAVRSSRPGDRLRIKGVPLFDGPEETLDLERFEVFNADARLQVQTEDGLVELEPPTSRLFRGTVEGNEASMAYVAVQEDGTVQGLVAEEDRLFLIGSDSETNAVKIGQLEDMDEEARRVPFTCGNEAHGAELDVANLFPQMLPSGRSGIVSKRSASSANYAVEIALETDWEFFELFGSTNAALDYINLLFGAIATIYERDVDTQLRISYTQLYNNPSDPWGTNTNSYLQDLRSYWAANNSDVERTLVHFLRGRRDGFGVAYVGVLCSTSYGFGLTTSIRGNYNPSQTVPVWDLVAVAHELGHNFASRHTHCYSPPIDQCHTSGTNCHSGATSVPSDGGTIMSYCHLRSGGMSNINTWLGRAGHYGNQSERVNQVMLNHLSSAQASGCLPDVQETSLIFGDSFESGSVTSWSIDS